MERKKFNIIVNFDKPDVITGDDIEITKGDYKSIEFDFQMNKNDYTEAQFFIVKPDGTHFSSLIENNKVLIEDSSVFNQKGYYAMGIALYGSDSRLTNTKKRKIHVVDGDFPTDDEVQAEANYPILDQLIQEVSALLYDNAIYGVKRALNNNTSPLWTRIYASQTLVANATHDGSAVVNDFDNIYPWSDIKSYNYDTTNHVITAWYGDANFKFDGSNGEVLTRIPAFYWKRYRDDDYEYILISKASREGFNYSPAFSVGRYDSSFDGTNLHSISGANPEVSRNISSFRTLSKAVDTGFGQLDYHYFLLQMLYLVEYASYNSQDKLGKGITSMRINGSDKALVAETGVNRIIINSSSASNFIVGQQMSIGATATGQWGVAKYRTITSIEDYDSGGITGKAIYFDGDAVDIAIDNVIWSHGQMAGHCDSLGMKSGCLSNDGKHGMIYRGIENILGNVYQFIDGINIKDYVAYICYDPAEYVSDKFTAPYQEVGYTNSSNSDVWAKALGYDGNHPLVALTTETGGSDSTNLCDRYYSNSGNRIALVGGIYSYGTYAGLWCWNLYTTSSYTSNGIGSRLLRYQD